MATIQLPTFQPLGTRPSTRGLLPSHVENERHVARRAIRLARHTHRPARSVLVLDELGGEIDAQLGIVEGLNAAFARVIERPAVGVYPVGTLLTCISEA